MRRAWSDRMQATKRALCPPTSTKFTEPYQALLQSPAMVEKEQGEKEEEEEEKVKEEEERKKTR
jgi:hypothetical protein